jgi:hypothetical protein
MIFIQLMSISDRFIRTKFPARKSVEMPVTQPNQAQRQRAAVQKQQPNPRIYGRYAHPAFANIQQIEINHCSGCGECQT